MRSNSVITVQIPDTLTNGQKSTTMGNHWAKRHMYMESLNTLPKRPQPRGGSRKGRPNHTTAEIREVITQFAGNNSARLSRWLTEIEAQDGPKAALDAYVKVLEFALPKRAAVDLQGGATINILAILDRAQQTGLDGLLQAQAPTYIEHDPAKYAEADAAYRERQLAELDKPFDPLAFEPDAE